MAQPAPALRVGGFVPFTATDFPGALAAVVFCQGCPWRCGYCHNPHLVLPVGPEAHKWPALLQRLEQRQGLLDAVVFSGGEPTAQPALRAAMLAVRALGFAVGLHTGGAYPRRLEAVLPIVDWVGFDVKAPALDYACVTGVPGSGGTAQRSLTRVLAAGVACEVRTTVHGALTTPRSLLQLARELAACGVVQWVLQPFRVLGCTNEALVGSPLREAGLDEALLARLRVHVPTIVVRR